MYFSFSKSLCISIQLGVIRNGVLYVFTWILCINIQLDIGVSKAVIVHNHLT